MNVPLLRGLFENCSLGVVVKQGAALLYENACARKMSAEISPGLGKVCGLAAWEIEVDGAPAVINVLVPHQRDDPFERVIQGAPVGLALLDHSLRYVLVNEKLAAMSGDPADAFPGKTLDEATHIVSPQLAPRLRGVIDSGQPERNLKSTRIKSEEGNVDEQDLLVNLGRVTCGGMHFVVAAVFDYAESIEAPTRDALQATGSKYRKLFDGSPVGIVRWREGGEVVEANDAFLRTMGWTREQLTSDHRVPDRLGHHLNLPSIVQSIPCEEEWIRDDGTAVSVRVLVVDRDAATNETLAYVSDLSVERKAESASSKRQELVQFALESAELAVWEWDIVAGKALWSDAWARMLGYAAEELSENPNEWSRRVHPEDLTHVERNLQAHFAGESTAYESEHRMQCRSGDWKWTLTRGKVTRRSPDGTPMRFVGTQMDISARKGAELALARSEQRFHIIFDKTYQFTGLLDRDGILLEANQSALSFGGFAREDVIGLPFWKAGWWQISEATQQRLIHSIAIAATGEFVRYEVDVWGANQVSTTIDFSLRPVLDSAGIVDLIIAEGRDITELKNAQQLHRAEAERRRLQAVLRSMTKGVVIADPQGNVTFMNPAALSILGFPSEQHAKKPLMEYQEFELRGLDGRLVPLNEWPLSRILRGETFFAYEIEVIRLDTGKRFIGSFGGAPVRGDDGEVILVVQTFRDVTHQHEIERALRRSEQERDLALQAGQMQIWRVEFGPERTSPTLPLGPTESIHAEDRTRVQTFIEDIETNDAKEIEYRVVTTDGQYAWRSSRGRRIVSERGDIVGVTGVTWDISERKKAETAIERANVSLHQLSGELLRLQDEERRRLARELHDGPVQTLAAAAMNLSVLARSPNLSPFQREQRIASDCLEWVKQCSEEMRNLSYLLHPPILDELGLTSAVRGWVRGFAERTGLDVDLDLQEAGRLGPESETALFRIVQEALGNVHRHSHSAVVCVRLHRSSESITLEIEDRGRGIPQGVLEGQSESHSLGVGIRGMRERARQLGGHMTIQSRPGRTLISIRLPERSLDEAH